MNKFILININTDKSSWRIYLIISNIQNHNGDTPLHIAINEGNQDIIEILLKNGADPVITNYGGISSFHLLDKNPEMKWLYNLALSRMRR